MEIALRDPDEAHTLPLSNQNSPDNRKKGASLDSEVDEMDIEEEGEEEEGKGEDDIINIVFKPEDQNVAERKSETKMVYKKFYDISTTLHKRNDFTDQEIDDNQLEMDDFVRRLVGLCDYKAITNYIHDMEAGYISDYLRIYRNLYRYSNNNLEANVKVSKL
jgi:hypothetical protein